MGTYRQPGGPYVPKYGEIISKTIDSLSTSFSKLMKERKANQIANQKLIKKNQIAQSKYNSQFEKTLNKAQKKQAFNETQFKQVEKYRKQYRDLHGKYGEQTDPITGEKYDADTRRAELLLVATEISSGQGMIDGLVEGFDEAYEKMLNDSTGAGALDTMDISPEWMHFLQGGWEDATYVNPASGPSYYEFTMPSSKTTTPGAKPEKEKTHKFYIKETIEAATGNGDESKATQPFSVYGDANAIISPLLDANKEESPLTQYIEDLEALGDNPTPLQINELNDSLSDKLDVLLNPKTNSSSPVNDIKVTSDVYNPLFKLVSDAAKNKNSPFNKLANELLYAEEGEEDDLEYGKYLSPGDIQGDAGLKDKQERQQKLAALGYKLTAFKDNNPYGIQSYVEEEVVGEEEEVVEEVVEEVGTTYNQPKTYTDDKVKAVGKRITDIEFEYGMGVEGKAHDKYGFNTGTAPKDSKEAQERFAKEYGAEMIDGLDDEILFQTIDWKFNANRSGKHLLLYASGKLGEGIEGRQNANNKGKLTDAQMNKLFEENKAEIIKASKDPGFKKKIMNAKMELYLSPKQKESYSKEELKKGLKNVWGKRIGYSDKEIDTWIKDNFDTIYNEKYEKAAPTQTEFDAAWANAKIGDIIVGVDGNEYEKK